MANLGNSKIKDTYQLVLQTDAGGNLQKLDGSTPNPFIINQNLRYLDGTTHPSGYVLVSDGSGNASWGAVSFSGDVYISGGSINSTTIELQTTSGATVSIPGLSWSSNTSGHISNSGLTGNVGIGTSIPNKPLTVVGDISGTTDLYLGSSTHTASTITAQEQLIIRGRGADNDFMTLKEDTISFSLDGSQSINFTSPTSVGAGGTGSYLFNASSNDYDFKIKGDDATPIFNVTGSENRIRVRDHLTIGDNSAISHSDAVNWGLAVTGSSLFYSGGTSHNTEAIVAIGNISGTTDLYLGSATHTDSTIIAEDSLTIKGTSGNDYLYLQDDLIRMYMDGSQLVDMTPTSITLNGSSSAVDFHVYSDDATNLIRTRAEHNIVRLLDHVSINSPTGWVASNEKQQALAVSGTSVFYSGGTSHNSEAIVAIGNISGTTDLYIDGVINGDSVVATTYNSTTSSSGYELNGAKYLWLTSGDLQVGNVGADTDIIGTSISLQTATTINDNLTVTGNTNISGSTSYIGAISGTGSVTAIGGFVGDMEGNAATATALETARTIGGISFNGTANINLRGVNAAGNQDTSGNAATSTKIDSITNNNIVQLTSTQTLTNKTLTSPIFNTGISGSAFLDEDNMVSNSANKVASQQSIKSYINNTRMDWMKTTAGIKLLSSNNWVGFNKTTGGLDSSGFWNADNGGTALSNVHAFYGSYWNTMFTAPYPGYLKRLIIQGANTTNSEVGQDWNIYLAKSPVVNDSDSISWSEVTGFTRTLPEDRNKRFIYDIPLNGTTGLAISQYDTFILAFQGTNGATTWITANIILEFEYNI